MLKAKFLGNVLFIEDIDDHLTTFTAYSSKYRTSAIHNITDEDLDSLINALMREEHRRQSKKEEAK